MKRNSISLLLLSAMLIAGSAAYADSGGASADVNGDKGANSPGIDPNGMTKDGGASIDTDGFTVSGDGGGSMDPSGFTASGQSLTGASTAAAANITESLMGAYFSLLPKAAF